MNKKDIWARDRDISPFLRTNLITEDACEYCFLWQGKTYFPPLRWSSHYVAHTSIKLFDKFDLHEREFFWNYEIIYYYTPSYIYLFIIVLSFLLFLGNSLSIFYIYYSYFYKNEKLTSLEGSTLRLFSLCNDQGIFCINFRKPSVSAYLEVLQLLRTQKNIRSLIKSCCFHPHKETHWICRGIHWPYSELVKSNWLV